MNSILRRRRALISAGWEDITGQLSFGTWTGVTFDQNGDQIRVYSTVDGQYRAIRSNFSTDAGYMYKYTCDSITVTSGRALIACRNSSSGIINATSSGQIATSTGPVEKYFGHNPNIALLSLFCTFDTTGAGDVTYHNFRLWRKKG